MIIMISGFSDHAMYYCIGNRKIALWVCAIISINYGIW